MKITGLEVLTLPDHGDSMMLVVVDTDEGIHGLGEVGIRSRQRAVAGGLEHLAELIVGEDPRRIEHLWQVMFRRGFFPADRILGAAVAAVDVALWDIRGKALGVPVHELLGGRVRDHVPAYVHVGDGYDDRAWFLDRCRDLVAEGGVICGSPRRTTPTARSTPAAACAVRSSSSTRCGTRSATRWS